MYKTITEQEVFLKGMWKKAAAWKPDYKTNKNNTHTHTHKQQEQKAGVGDQKINKNGTIQLFLW